MGDKKRVSQMSLSSHICPPVGFNTHSVHSSSLHISVEKKKTRMFKLCCMGCRCTLDGFDNTERPKWNTSYSVIHYSREVQKKNIGLMRVKLRVKWSTFNCF